MKLAIAQIKTRAGAFEETARRMVEYSRRAAEQGVELLVFPMAALCGSSPVQPVDREGFMIDLADCVMGLLDELACPCLVPVLTELGDASLPDALLVADGDVTPVAISARLGAAAAGSESSEGAGLPEFSFAGARLGVAFSYEDLDVYNDYEYNVDVIIYLGGYGFSVDDPSSALGSSLTEGRFLKDAETTGSWIVGVGSLGCYDLQVFCGSSFVLAPWGELAAQAPSLEEALLVCDVDPSAEGPLAEPLTPEVYDAPLMTWGALSMGLSEACELAGAPGACLVADGSLASSLAAALATDALGPKRVRVLSAPADAAAEQAVSDLLRSLRIPSDHIARSALGSGEDQELDRDLAQVELAALARETGFLPLGARDKTGRALEGPPGVDASCLNPFGDLYRSDLLSLAHLRNTMSPVIPVQALASFAVPEIDGISEGLGGVEARLNFIDLVLSSYVEWELPLSDIVSERGRAELVTAVIARLRARGDAPRQLGAPSLMMSSRTLGESMAPFGLAWVDHPRPAEGRLAGRLSSLAEKDESQDDAQEREGRPETGVSHEQEVHDLLGYLRDFSAGGVFSPFGASGPSGQGERHGEGPSPFWEGPFSQN